MSSACDINVISSASLVNMDGLTAEAFQDAVQTLKAVQEICQRLDKWAVEELADPSTSLPPHDLVQYCEVAHQQLSAYFTAVKAVHHNNVMRGESQFMSENSRRLQEEAATLFPKIFAFEEDLLKISKRGYSINYSKDSPYPEKAQVQEIIQKFLYLSSDWAKHTESITDTFNIRSYKTSSDVPYKEVIGVAVGSGGFGTVYKAESADTRTVVAIKQLSRLYSTKSQDKVHKELSILQMCNHPNIVKLLDAYQINDHPGTFYLVMEPWAPYTLSRFLHQSDSQRHHESPWFIRGNFETERQVIQIFRDLSDGLDYLHKKSIKHKDLKPENILLYDAGPHGIRPVIADLGISKIFKDGNPTDCNKSTYAYLAPEQVKCVGSTLRSDVWQLGCCFAFTLAVLRQGSVGCQELWNSFENSNEDCTCNIAEAPTFMKTFKTLCGHGSTCQRSTYRLVTAMLEVDPESRFDIATVRTELADL